MEIKIIKSKFMRGIMDQNTYIVTDGENSIIIDAGADIEDVLEQTKNTKVLAVLLTHLHFDHFWCIEDYISAFDCNVFICEGFEEKFADVEKNGSTIVRKEITRKVNQKNIEYYRPHLKLGNFDIDVLFTAGHCADCVCLKIENVLFSGDTLFASGIGRTDIFDSSNKSMIESLKLIKNQDVDFIYPGHYENMTKKQAEKIIDSFLDYHFYD